MIIQNLLSVYNFIPVQQPPLLEIQWQLLENYPTISKILRMIFLQKQHQNSSIDEMYFSLNEFISREQETLGPKRFKNLIQNIFTIVFQNVLNILRSPTGKSDELYFHLAYFKKNCGKYIDHFYSCCILTFYIISSFNLKQLQSVEQKIKECRVTAKFMQHEKEMERQSIVFFRLCAIFESFCCLLQQNFKKSKDLCSKILNIATLQLTQSIRGKRMASSIVKLELMLCSLTVTEIYKQLGKYDLEMFMMNKCIEYSERFLEDNYQFLKLMKADRLRPKVVQVKLTRLEEKIRRIQLIEEQEVKKLEEKRKSKTILRNNTKYNRSNGQLKDKSRVNSLLKENLSQTRNKLTFPKQNIPGSKSRTFHYATLRSGSQISLHQQNKLSLNNLEKVEQAKQKQSQEQLQLQNLLIVKDKKKNYFRLKEETLKFLNKENNQLKRQIRIKDIKIGQLNTVKDKLNDQLNLEHLKQQINQCQEYQNALIRQIGQSKWKNLGQLPQVKKIGNYLKTFIQSHSYQHAKHVQSVVNSDTLNLSKIKMISMLKRKIHKKNKLVISQVTSNSGLV